MSSGFTTEQRGLLDRLADVLVPEFGRMPAASAVGIADGMLDRVLNLRPDLRTELGAVLRKAEGQEPESWVRQLAGADPVLFHALATVVAHGYYMSDEVRGLIGYPGQERLPFDPDETPEYVINGMMQRVLASDLTWRDPRLPTGKERA